MANIGDEDIDNLLNRNEEPVEEAQDLTPWIGLTITGRTEPAMYRQEHVSWDTYRTDELEGRIRTLELQNARIMERLARMQGEIDLIPMIYSKLLHQRWWFNGTYTRRD